MVFSNLWLGYNKEEDFKIIICAFDREEAQELADEYRLDSNMVGKFEIIETNIKLGNENYDCDYIIA